MRASSWDVNSRRLTSAHGPGDISNHGFVASTWRNISLFHFDLRDSLAGREVVSYTGMKYKKRLTCPIAMN